MQRARDLTADLKKETEGLRGAALGMPEGWPEEEEWVEQWRNQARGRGEVDVPQRLVRHVVEHVPARELCLGLRRLDVYSRGSISHSSLGIAVSLHAGDPSWAGRI